ncbi:MAG: 30S ribosomal protein S1 [Desulfomonilia bacterium]
MPDNTDDDRRTIPEKDFDSLLDSYGSDMRENIRVGDRIQGRILSIGRDYVIVDTGSKLDGIVEKEELIDDTGVFPYSEGDTLDLFVMSIRHGELKLSRALAGIGGMSLLQDAYRAAIPVEGRVVETCKGGYSVEVIKHRAFCPISQMDTIYIEDPEAYVGKTFHFLISELEEGGRNIVLSRRTLLEQEQEQARQDFFSSLCPERILDGTVTRLMPYGAFVELTPGVEGMVHISEMSWSRIAHPDELLTHGEHVKVKVLSVEDDPEKKEKKISLSIKQVEDDPWNSVQEKFAPGLKLRGTVTRCMDYGVFVEIAPGIEGLVHISEMSYKKRVTKPREIASEGETVDVMIKEIIPHARRISLSIKDAEGDPWIGIQERYTKDQILEGVIEKKERFGYFVRLEPGVTGLLPRSKIVQHHDAAALEKKQEGESITVAIENIDPAQRKLSLTPGDSLNLDEWKNFSESQDVGVGSLGEKLKQAFKSKKTS